MEFEHLYQWEHSQLCVCSCEFTTLNLQEVSDVTKQPEAAKPTQPHSPADVTAVHLRVLTLEVKKEMWRSHWEQKDLSVLENSYQITPNLAMMEGKYLLKQRWISVSSEAHEVSAVYLYWSWTGIVFSAMGDKGRHVTACVFCSVIIILAVWDWASAFQ